MTLTGKNRITRIRVCPSEALSATNPTRWRLLTLEPWSCLFCTVYRAFCVWTFQRNLQLDFRATGFLKWWSGGKCVGHTLIFFPPVTVAYNSIQSLNMETLRFSETSEQTKYTTQCKISKDDRNNSLGENLKLVTWKPVEFLSCLRIFLPSPFLPTVAEQPSIYPFIHPSIHPAISLM
jgi:hypothetical protein